MKYDRLSKPTSKETSIIALLVEVNKIDDFSSLKLLIYWTQVKPICFLKKRIKWYSLYSQSSAKVFIEISSE